MFLAFRPTLLNCRRVIGCNSGTHMRARKQKLMGTFYVRCKVENHVDRSKSVVVPKLLVDTGSDYTWVPAKLLEKIGVEREKRDCRSSWLTVRASRAAWDLPSYAWTITSRLTKSRLPNKGIATIGRANTRWTETNCGA